MLGLAEGLSAGFGMGMRGMQARDERERRAREDAWVDERRSRLRQQEGREDAAFRDLETLQRDGAYEGATGLSQPSMQHLAAGNGPAYGSGEAAIREATGDYAREASRMPNAGPAYNPQAEVKRRSATDLELERAYGGVATARRDIKGMRESGDRQRALRENELIAKAEVNDDTIRYLNQNHRSLTLGDADKDGFRQLSYVNMDGKAQFERLSKADQKKLAAAQALWDVNPERAMKMVGEVNKGLAEMFESESRMADIASRGGNDVAHKRGGLQLDRLRVAETSRHNQALERDSAIRLGLQRDAAAREKWQFERLRLGDELGREAAGYTQGMHDATAAGPQGRAAYDIYAGLLGGVQQRMRGIGLNPGGREQMGQKDILAAEADLIRAGMTPEQARARVTEYDPMKVMREMLKARKESSRAPADGGASEIGVPAVATGPRPVDRQARAAQIAAELAADDRIKAGGLSGMGGRAIAEGRFPMGIAQRLELERELATLRGPR